jgi:hypothetical protein
VRAASQDAEVTEQRLSAFRFPFVIASRRRSNPDSVPPTLDCFVASLLATTEYVAFPRLIVTAAGPTTGAVRRRSGSAVVVALGTGKARGRRGAARTIFHVIAGSGGRGARYAVFLPRVVSFRGGA